MLWWENSDMKVLCGDSVERGMGMGLGSIAALPGRRPLRLAHIVFLSGQNERPWF